MAQYGENSGDAAAAGKGDEPMGQFINIGNQNNPVMPEVISYPNNTAQFLNS